MSLLLVLLHYSCILDSLSILFICSCSCFYSSFFRFLLLLLINKVDYSWISFCSQTDLELPKIANCPHNIHKTSSTKFTKIFLPGVTVTDNVGVYVFTTSRTNGSDFTWGEHNITYTASDKAGNTAKCHFQVIITGRLVNKTHWILSWTKRQIKNITTTKRQ